MQVRVLTHVRAWIGMRMSLRMRVWMHYVRGVNVANTLYASACGDVATHVCMHAYRHGQIPEIRFD
jgi:hypothetical protein